MERPVADVQHREVGDDSLDAPHPCQRQGARVQQFRRTRAVRVLHGHDDVLGRGNEVHRAPHAFHHFARNLPVGDVPVGGDFHRAQHRQLHVAATDHGERGGAVEEDRPGPGRDGLLAGVDQVGVFVALLREGPHAEDAVFTLEFHLHAGRNVVGHQGRDADAQVHIPPVLNLLRDALGDAVFVQHGVQFEGVCGRTVRCSMRFS